MTADAPTWGEVERFLKNDGWKRLPSASRGGSSENHILFEKLLDSGRLLQTHISHSRSGRPSPGRFSTILRHQLEISRDEFWRALREGAPVERPVPVEDQSVEHEAWVVAVLVGELHMSADEIAALDAEQARRLVFEHWARPVDGS